MTLVTGVVSGSVIMTEDENGVCQGDSGGPLIDATGAVRAVTSRGECGVSGVFLALGAHQAFIDETLAAARHCEDDGTCLERDQACERHGDCGSGICADLDAGRVCAEECDPGVAGVCGEGRDCAGVAPGQFLCVPYVELPADSWMEPAADPPSVPPAAAGTGSCSAGGQGAGAVPALLSMVVAIAAARRRRRQ
jgi:MYXO-CTERM domain-containing protein